MAVNLFQGTPGSGKSVHMAQNIWWQLKAGKIVAANFEIAQDSPAAASLGDKLDNFKYIPNEQLNPKNLIEAATRYWEDHPTEKRTEGKFNLYIDEAQLLFQSRIKDYSNEDRMEWIRFFTQHRKIGYQIYLATQFDEMLDKQIRAVIENQVIHLKLNRCGILGRILSVLTLGHPIFVCNTYWYGIKPRMRLSSEFKIGTKKYYDFFDTWKIF